MYYKCKFIQIDICEHSYVWIRSTLSHFATPLARWKPDLVATRIHIKFRGSESHRSDDETKKRSIRGDITRLFVSYSWSIVFALSWYAVDFARFIAVSFDRWSYFAVLIARRKWEGYFRYFVQKFRYEIAVTWMKLLLTSVGDAKTRVLIEGFAAQERVCP